MNFPALILTIAGLFIHQACTDLLNESPRVGILAVGGGTTEHNATHVRLYDMTSNRWKDVASLNQGRKYFGVASIGNRVYAAGGSDEDGTPLESVEMYDHGTNKWTLVKPMSEKRRGAGMAALNGHLYVFGGYSFGHILNSAEEYNPNTNEWTPIAPMPVPRYSLGAASVAGCVYAIGGFNGALSRDVEKYCPRTGTWQQVAPLGVERSGFAAAELDGHLYVCGGNGPRLDRDGYIIRYCERYDPVADKWSEFRPMFSKREYFGMAAAQNRVFVVGGFNGQLLNEVLIYNPRENKWITAASLPLATYGLGATAVVISTTNTTSNNGLV